MGRVDPAGRPADAPVGSLSGEKHLVREAAKAPAEPTEPKPKRSRKKAEKPVEPETADDTTDE